MDVLPSPPPCAVGEAAVVKQNENTFKQSYASILSGQNSFEKPSNATVSHANRNDPSKLELCAVNFEHDHPVIKFSMENVNTFTREEGLHQAVVIKFTYGFPHVSEVRRIFASQFDVKGRCNVGQLEYRHLLIRFDLFDDYAHFIGKSTGFLKSKGEEFFFRTFSWTFGFNPKEETSMAVVWISMLGLPPNLFARRSLLSIESAVGKSIAVDKATQDRTRPSAARVKVIINLLDNHPKMVKLKFVDSTSEKSVEVEQIIVYDNLPSYCDFCKHQGHEERVCRLKSGSKFDYLASISNGNGNIVAKLQGDAREFLNKKRDAQGKVGHNNHNYKKDQGVNMSETHKLNAVWKQKSRAEPTLITESDNIHSNGILMKSPSLPGPSVITVNGKEARNQQVDQTVTPNSPNVVVQQCKLPVSEVLQTSYEPSAHEPAGALVNGSELVQNILSADTRNALGNNLANAVAKSPVEDSVVDTAKMSKSTFSLKSLSKEDFEYSIANSTKEVGSMSGEPEDLTALQNAVGSFEQFTESAVITSDVLASHANTVSLAESDNKLTAEDIQCEMIHNQMPVLEEGLIDCEPSAKIELLTEHCGEPEQQHNTVPLGRGELTLDQPNTMQPSIQAVFDCQRMGSEGLQCKGSRNEAIELDVLTNVQTFGQQLPKGNASVHASKQLHAASAAHLDRNSVSLKNDKVQNILEGSQCEFECHKDGKEECHQNVAINTSVSQKKKE